nr:hypothetical protein CFP56_06680 [Quercus suber]
MKVLLLQTFIWEHLKDYIDVGKDVSDVKATNWVVRAAGPNGEFQFLGFGDDLPLLMKWMGLKPYSYVAAGFRYPNPFPSARPGSQEFGLNDYEKISNFLLITSPSFISYPSGAGFGLTQYNTHRVLRQFGFDQDILDINTTLYPLSDAMQPLVHDIVIEFWASKVEKVLVPTRHREGYATLNMKLYWRRVMSTFVDYMNSREVEEVVTSPPLRELSSNTWLIPNTRAASTWATR